MGTISLEGMEFSAHHGCFDEERTIGARFIVDLHLTVDIAQAAATDMLAHTVNYQDVYSAVSREMELPSKLLEHVAGRIATRLLADFAAVANVAVKVCKCNPPLGGKIRQTSVTITQSKLNS
jgi:dihydroneopterin aldolase